MKKKAGIFVLIGTLLIGTLSGCSSFDGDATALSVGTSTLSADEANFYARYIQAQYDTYYEAYFGENMWTSEAEEGVTYEESVKETVQETLTTMLLMEMHMDDYGVTLTEEEEELIDKYTDQFSEDNALDVKEQVSGDEDSVHRIMTLFTIEDKMTTAIEADADTEVSDEEACQKKMDYVEFELTDTDEDGNDVEMTDEEKEKVKDTAEQLVKDVRAGGSFEEQVEYLGGTMLSATFDSESTYPDEAVIQAADELDKGEVTDVIETEDSYYVAQVTSLMDEDATETRKNEIVEERKEELLEDVVEGWKDAEEIEVNDSVWKAIDFQDLNVLLYIDESDDYTDPIETDDVAQSQEETEEDDQEELSGDDESDEETSTEDE